MTSPASSKGWFWIGMVFALLALNFSICTITVVAARRSQPPIEANYDTKALRWDDSAQQRAANQRLGWKARFESLNDPTSRTPYVLVQLLDADGRPIRIAEVVADLQPDSGSTPIRVTMTSDDAGAYRAALPADARGWWRIAIAAHAGGLRFCESSRVLVSQAAVGAAR